MSLDALTNQQLTTRLQAIEAELANQQTAIEFQNFRLMQKVSAYSAVAFLFLGIWLLNCSSAQSTNNIICQKHIPTTDLTIKRTFGSTLIILATISMIFTLNFTFMLHTTLAPLKRERAKIKIHLQTRGILI